MEEKALEDDIGGKDVVTDIGLSKEKKEATLMSRWLLEEACR